MSQAQSTINWIPHTDVFGVKVSRLGMRETVDRLAAAVNDSHDPMHIITANPIMLMHALEHPSFHRVMRAADLNVPDGAGLVWAATYLGEPVAERVAGYDLMHELLRTGENYNWKVWLLGAEPEVVEAAAKKVGEQYPGIQVAGWHHGFFTADEEPELIERIRDAKPHLLFVANSLDKQEGWIARHRDSLAVPIMMGVGGSFDVLSGKLRRAPLWLQRLRLEWLYRLLQEPSRYRRMLALPRFVLRVMKEKRNRNKGGEH